MKTSTKEKANVHYVQKMTILLSSTECITDSNETNQGKKEGLQAPQKQM
jgi:hypothetical protein